MDRRTESDSSARRAHLANYLKTYFDKQQGVRLGETAVVSRRVHKKSRRKFPHVQILIEQDAGKAFLQLGEPEQAVHIDVYHEPAEIQLFPLARRLWRALTAYHEEKEKDIPPLEREKAVNFFSLEQLGSRVTVATLEGEGTLLYLVQKRQGEAVRIAEDLSDHVHVLLETPEEWYDLIPLLVEEVEAAVQEQGYQLRKLMGITHGFQKGPRAEELKGLLLPVFSRERKEIDDIIYRQNQNQVILTLASYMGSVEEVREFLDNMSGNFFKRVGTQAWRKIKGHLEQWADQIVDQMIEAGLVEKGLFGPSLTEEGERLRDYLVLNQKELEAELRKMMRRLPGGARRYQRYARSQSEVRKIEVLNKRKILRYGDREATSVVAVPETVMHAAKSSLRERRGQVRISREDLQAYGKRAYVPIDICLLVDCSASMAGDKMQAAWQLAEHLVLSSRERVAVVVFQEMSARVVVPFTRNQRRLKAGLRSVQAMGMTPLASGLMKSLEHIRESKVRNPLLVLITDGMPTYPLWTFDSKADALKAAREVAEAKIHLMCIGVRSNREFLKELADVANGSLYVVDHLTRDTLIQVLAEERALLSGRHENNPSR